MNKSTAIKKYCIECSGNSRANVLACQLVECPLWTFRTGESAVKNQQILRSIVKKNGGKTKDIVTAVSEAKITVQKPVGTKKPGRPRKTTGLLSFAAPTASPAQKPE